MALIEAASVGKPQSQKDFTEAEIDQLATIVGEYFRQSFRDLQKKYVEGWRPASQVTSVEKVTVTSHDEKGRIKAFIKEVTGGDARS